MTRHSMDRESAGYSGILEVSNESVRIRKRHMNQMKLGEESTTKNSKVKMPEAAARALLSLQKGRKYQFELTAMAVIASNKAQRKTG